MTSKQFLKLSFSLITSHIFEVLLYISRRSLNFKIVPSEKESIPAQKIRWSATEYIYFIFGCDYFTITTSLSANFNLFAKLCLHNWKWLPLHVFIDFSPHCSNLNVVAVWSVSFCFLGRMGSMSGGDGCSNIKLGTVKVIFLHVFAEMHTYFKVTSVIV